MIRQVERSPLDASEETAGVMVLPFLNLRITFPFTLSTLSISKLRRSDFLHKSSSIFLSTMFIDCFKVRETITISLLG